MDVERMQKINLLAKELMKHNIASSSEEASAQAEKILKSADKDLGADNNIIQIKEKTDLETLQQPQVERELNNLNNSLRMLNGTLSALKEQVGKISVDMEMMKTQFNEVLSLKRRIVQEEQKTAPRQERQVATRETKVLGPGGVDVSVDKIFYSGSGKK